MTARATRLGPLILLILVCTPIDTRAEAAPDGYADSMLRAAGEAAQDRWIRAADILDAMAGRFPEDYQLQLNRAWYHFQGGDYQSARDAYDLALDISQGSLDARLGLGWCAQRLGDLPEARTQFEAVLTSDPDNLKAAEGLSRVGSGYTVQPGAFLFFEKYHGHPWRDFQVGTTASLDLIIRDHLLLSAGYRYLFLHGMEDTTNGIDEFDVHQHEAFASLGWTSSSWGLAGHGAFAHYDDSGNLAEGIGSDSGMVGLSARYTWWADFLLSATYSFYDDIDVVQGKVGTALPVVDWLTLSGYFEFQYGDDQFWPSGAIEVLFHAGFGFLGLGGTVGTRLRPVDLADRTMYNTTDRPSGTARVRAGFGLGKGVTLHVSYEFERLLAASKTGDVETGYGHRVAAGLSLTLP